MLERERRDRENEICPVVGLRGKPLAVINNDPMKLGHTINGSEMKLLMLCA